MSNSSEKEGTTNEISLSLDLNVKDGNNLCIGVSEPCLSILVCLLEYNSAGTLLFLFFSKIWAPKLGVRLIYGCGLYTDVYGTYCFWVDFLYKALGHACRYPTGLSPFHPWGWIFKPTMLI